MKLAMVRRVPLLLLQQPQRLLGWAHGLCGAIKPREATGCVTFVILPGATISLSNLLKLYTFYYFSRVGETVEHVQSGPV